MLMASNDSSLLIMDPFGEIMLILGITFGVAFGLYYLAIRELLRDQARILTAMENVRYAQDEEAIHYKLERMNKANEGHPISTNV
ncbi:hypothetical protein IWZ00DRAFT_543083 [Phyllosticta capitalensis]